MAANGHVEKSQAPVAYITGGASGMGLSVVERLVSQGWNVTITDLNETAGQKVAERLGQQVVFIKTDITDYEQQAKAFVETWNKWRRLDFVFANAGIGDRIDFFAPAKEREDGSPPKPDTLVIDACLLGVVYSAYLAFHFFRKNENKAGKLVSTSSMCGLYPGLGIPLYTAAKHGVVGLTRALSSKLAKLGEPITVNCLCPGLVDTGLTGLLMEVAPSEYVTPHSTIVRAVESFLNDDSKNGLAAECSGENIHYRVQQEFGDDKAAWIMGDNFEELFKQRYEGRKDVKTS